MNRRQKLNREILERLMEYNERSPDQRFGQLLVNAGVSHDISDRFEGFASPLHSIFYNEESDKILSRVLDNTKVRNGN